THVHGFGVIHGIDEFMSEARALTHLTGDGVAAVLLGKWNGDIDLDVARATQAGGNLFDELSLETDAHGAPTDAEATSDAEAQVQTAADAEAAAPAAGEKEKVAALS